MNSAAEHTDNVPTTVVHSMSSSANLATESSSMTRATNNVNYMPNIQNQASNTTPSSNAPVKQLIRKITPIDPRKLQQAGLDRKIAEALSKQKLQMSVNKSAKSASSHEIYSTTSVKKSVQIIPSCSSTTVIQSNLPSSLSVVNATKLPTKSLMPPKITITGPEVSTEADKQHLVNLSPEQRLKHVKYLLNKKILLKKVSNQNDAVPNKPGMAVHLKPPAPVAAPSKKVTKLLTIANTPPPPPTPQRGFIHLIDAQVETTPTNKPVTKTKTPQKSPQDIARKLDFQMSNEGPKVLHFIRKNPTKFFKKLDNFPSTTHSEKLPESENNIPKASIKPVNPNLHYNNKQFMLARQKSDFPEVSPLKTPFPTVNIPQEAPLPTIDTFKKPYPMPASDYYHMQTETQHHIEPSTMQYKTANYETLPPPSSAQLSVGDFNMTSSASSPNSLIVLENKVLSQDEMIDLTALRLSTSKVNTPQRFARPHKPIPEVVIKQEKPDDFPTTSTAPHQAKTATNIHVQKDRASTSNDTSRDMVLLSGKQNKKIIVNAQKLKLPQEKIAELAKKIAQRTAANTTASRANKAHLVETQTPAKSSTYPEIRVLHTKAEYKINSPTHGKKSGVETFQRNLLKNENTIRYNLQTSTEMQQLLNNQSSEFDIPNRTIDKTKIHKEPQPSTSTEMRQLLNDRNSLIANEVFSKNESINSQTSITSDSSKANTTYIQSDPNEGELLYKTISKYPELQELQIDQSSKINRISKIEMEYSQQFRNPQSQELLNYPSSKPGCSNRNIVNKQTHTYEQERNLSANPNVTNQVIARNQTEIRQQFAKPQTKEFNTETDTAEVVEQQATKTNTKRGLPNIQSEENFQQTKQYQEEIAVKEKPKTQYITSPPIELTNNLQENLALSPVIKPLPPTHGLHKVSIPAKQTYLTNPATAKDKTSSYFNSSFTGNRKSALDEPVETKVKSSSYFKSSYTCNRKSAVEIVDEPPETDDNFSAVDFLAAFANTNPITEETTLELSPEEFNLNASCAMNLSPMRIASYSPRKRKISTPQRQVTIPSLLPSASSHSIPNDYSMDIGNIVTIQDDNFVEIDSQNVSFSMENLQTMNTIIIQSSNGSETIVTKTQANKGTILTIPDNKAKPVNTFDQLNTTKMGLHKLKDMEHTIKSSQTDSINLPKISTTINTNKAKDFELSFKDFLNKSNKAENAKYKEAEILRMSKESENIKKSVQITNLSIKTPVKPTEMSAKKTEKSVKTPVTDKSVGLQSKVKPTLAKESKRPIDIETLREKETRSSETKTTADNCIQEKLSAKTPVESQEKPVSSKSIVNPALPKEIEKPFGIDTSKEKGIKSTDIEQQNRTESFQIMGETNLHNTALLKSIEKAVETTEISGKTPVTFKETAVSFKAILKPSLHVESKSTNVEFSKNIESMSTQSKELNATVDNTQKNLEGNSSLISPVKSPIKSINLKSILKSTVLSDVEQQNPKESSGIIVTNCQDLDFTKSNETSIAEDCNTTTSKELQSSQDNEQSKMNEASSTTAGPSKRISRFKKGKINLVQRNKPGAASKKPTETTEKIAEDKADKEEDQVKGDRSLSGSRNTEINVDIAVEKTYNKDRVNNESFSSVLEITAKSNETIIEPAGKGVSISGDKANKEDPVKSDRSLSGSNTEIEKTDNKDQVKNDSSLGGHEITEKSNEPIIEPASEGVLILSEEPVISDCYTIREHMISNDNISQNFVIQNVVCNTKPQSKDEQVEQEKSIHLKTTGYSDSIEKQIVISSSENRNLSSQNDLVISNTEYPDGNLYTTEVAEFVESIREVKEPYNKDSRTATAFQETDKAVTKISTEPIDISTYDNKTKELLEPKRIVEISSNAISTLLQPPKMPQHKSETKKSEDLDKMKLAKVLLIDIVKHSPTQISSNPPKLPFKKKYSDTPQKPEEEIKKSVEKENKSVENDYEKQKDKLKSETNENQFESEISSEDLTTYGKQTKRKRGRPSLPKSIESENQDGKNENQNHKDKKENPSKFFNEKESTEISFTELKEKCNENSVVSEISSEEPSSSDKSTQRKRGRPPLKRIEKSIVDAEKDASNSKILQNQKHMEKSDDKFTPKMNRISTRFNLNSESETPITSITAKPRHSSRHQISDDNFEYLPVNTETKEFKLATPGKSSNNKIKETERESSTEKSTVTKKTRLSSKPLETENAIEIVSTKPSEVFKRTRLISKTIETEAEELSSTPVTKRSRFSSQPSEATERHRNDSLKASAVSIQIKQDTKLLSATPKRTRFSSLPSEAKDTNRCDTSNTKIVPEKLFNISKTTQCSTKPTDLEDSYQDSPNDSKLSPTKQRKKLRKTLEDIKKSSQKPHLDTDSDEDHRDFDSMNDFEEGNEFLGFEENSAGSHKLQKPHEHSDEENQSKITSTKTKGGTLKNWLTTGKAISPTFNKNPNVKRLRHDDKLNQGVPLKKRWDLTKNLQEETDITDDTSPADDEDEIETVGKYKRSVKNVIDSIKDSLDSKKNKLVETKATKHNFLEPQPVGHKTKTSGTDSDCQELSTKISPKRSKISISEDKYTNTEKVLHKNVDNPVKEILATPDSKEIFDSTGKGNYSKCIDNKEQETLLSKISDSCSQKYANIDKSLLEEHNSKESPISSSKLNNTKKRNDTGAILEETQDMASTPAQSDFSTEGELQKLQSSSSKQTVSKTKTNKFSDSGSNPVQPDFRTEIESHETENYSSKHKSSNTKINKMSDSVVTCKETENIAAEDQYQINTKAESHKKSKTKKHNATEATLEATPDIATSSKSEETHKSFSKLKKSAASKEKIKPSECEVEATTSKKNTKDSRKTLESSSKHEKAKTSKEKNASNDCKASSFETPDATAADQSKNLGIKQKIKIKESSTCEEYSHKIHKNKMSISSNEKMKPIETQKATATKSVEHIKEIKDYHTEDASKHKNSKSSKEKKKLSVETQEATTSHESKNMNMQHNTEIKESPIIEDNLETEKYDTDSSLLITPLNRPLKSKSLIKRKLGMEVSEDESTPQFPKKRGRRKNILKIEDSEEECSPQIPKKRGRKRRICKIEDSSDDDDTPLKAAGKNSNIPDSLKPVTTPHLAIVKSEGCIRKRKLNNAESSPLEVNFNPRLLLITHRKQLDTDEILTESNPGSGPIQCGLCLKRTTTEKWSLHLAEHYGVGWEVGKQEVNIENRNTVISYINYYLKDTEIKGLSCRMCKKLYRSALGLLSHIESCGTPAIRLICEYCKRDYTKLTLQVHIRSCPERLKLENPFHHKEEEPEKTPEVFSNTGRLKRHSTIKAENKLKVIGAELEKATTEQAKEFIPKDHMKYAPPLDKEEVHKKWSQDLENFGKGFCPKKVCRFNSSLMDELENHIKKCKFIKTGYFCKFCKKRRFDTEQDVIAHITEFHKTGKNKSDDSDCNLKTDAEQSSEDDNELSEGVNEDEVEGLDDDDDQDVSDNKECYQKPTIRRNPTNKKKRHFHPETATAFRKRVYQARAYNVNAEVDDKWKNFVSVNYSSEPLFPDLTSQYSIINNQDFAKYLPSQVSSMKFNFEKQAKLDKAFAEPDPNIEWKELKRFEAVDNKTETFFFVGAPVKFCTWVPLPDDVNEQYILVGYRKEMFQFIKFTQPKKHHNILLIFKVTQSKKIPKLELHYGLTINDGPVHSAQFLPSGGYNVNTNRLGLVAVATVNSTIKIFSLPIKVEIEECDKIENMALIDITPSFQLNLDIMDQGQTNHTAMNPQCLGICWSEFSGHNHIFASFSNGFIGIWDITDEPQGNLNRFVVENVVNYASLNYFYSGEKGSNCLAIHYDTDGPRWLAVSAKHRKFLIYDIKNFMMPIVIKEEYNKNVMRCLNWSPVWGPMLGGLCDCIPNNGRCLNVINVSNIMFCQQRFENMVSAVTQIDYTPLTNLLVCTADNGDILFGDVRELHYEYQLGKKFGEPRRVLSSMDVKRLDQQAIVRPPTKQSKNSNESGVPANWTMYEQDYKDKYGLIFNPTLKLRESVKNVYLSGNRRGPINITPYMRINSLRCNLNMNAKRLVAAGYENGFLRIIYFNKDTQFSNW